MTVLVLWAAFFITGCVCFYAGRCSAFAERTDDNLCGWEGTDGADD